MEAKNFSTQRLDHLGIVAGMCRHIHLIEQIDTHVGPANRKVTVGEAVQAMVLNALGFTCRARCLTPEFFTNKPVDLLLRADLQAEDLNDDSLGRALDRLYEAGVTEVFARVASHALQVPWHPAPLRPSGHHQRQPTGGVCPGHRSPAGHPYHPWVLEIPPTRPEAGGRGVDLHLSVGHSRLAGGAQWQQR